MPHKPSCSSGDCTPRIFNIDRPLFKHRYDIRPNDSNRAFYVRNRPCTHTHPDLTLHSGPDATSPVIAVCHMPSFSSTLMIGLGDPSTDGDAVRWEAMTHANTSGTRRCWEMDLPARSSGGGIARRKFLWKHTYKVAVEGMKTTALNLRNWKLVEDREGNGEGAGEVLAVFTCDLARGKAGALQVNVDLGGDWETMVLITCLAIYERSRR